MAKNETEKQNNYVAIIETTLKNNQGSTITFFPEEIEGDIKTDKFVTFKGHYETGEAWESTVRTDCITQVKKTTPRNVKM